jgi:hypothetical protein
MVHGLLADEGNEFFIRPREATPGGSSSQQEQRDDTRQPGDTAARQSVPGAASSSKHLLNRSEVETYQDWHEAFEVGLCITVPFVLRFAYQQLAAVGNR